MSGTNHSGQRAWAVFFREHARALTAYALSLVGNEAEAEDLIQDVLVRMVQTDRPVSNARAYVFRCMRNRVIDARRAARRRPAVGPLSARAADCIETRVDDPAQRETAERVVAALADLSAEQREVIVLRIYTELTFREIAEILDRPMGTVAATYSRGLDRLRQNCRKELEDVR